MILSVVSCRTQCSQPHPKRGELAVPTVLGAKQPVENLLHHDGVELDEFRQSLNHLFLGGQGTAQCGQGWGRG